MRILHLSDTHIMRSEGPNRHGVDPRASLAQMLADVAEVPGIDVVLVTGDVADDGSREAYEHVRAAVGGFARDRGVPVLFTTGNHDQRDAFADVLQVESPLPTGDLAGVSYVDGYRIVTLDSLVPGEVYGRISVEQLRWLREVLVDPAPNGTVLAFHHPPIALDVEVQRRYGLSNVDELADAIRRTDVQLILCGHFHLQLLGHLVGTPVWVTPGVVNRIDLTVARGSERAVKGASATVVDLGGLTSPLLHLLHARDPHVGETSYELDADQVSAVLAQWARTAD